MAAGNIKTVLARALCLLLASVPAIGDAAEIFRASAGDQLRLELPAMDAPYLLVVLGEYDVSEFATIEGDGDALVLLVPEGLEAGETVLGLYASDGEKAELIAEYPVVLTGAAATEGNALSMQSRFETSRLLDEQQHPFSFPAQSCCFQTAYMAPQLAASAGDWQLSGSGNIAYNSHSENNMNGREWDLPQYQFSARRSYSAGDWLWQLGDQAAGGDSLIASGFSRRGISGRFRAGSDRAGAALFAVHSDASSGFRQLLLPRNRRSRSQGGNLYWQPFSTQPGKLKLTVSYISGAGTRIGAGETSGDPVATGVGETGGDPPSAGPPWMEENPVRFGGSAWSLQGESGWLDDSLNLEMEYAESHFDDDGLYAGAQAQRGNAWKMGFSLEPSSRLRIGWLDNWRAEARYREVAPDFYSIGNLYLPGNLATTQWQVSAQKQSFTFTLGGVDSTGNVDKLPYLPTQTQKQHSASLNYSVSVEEPAPWKLNGIALSYLRDGRSQPFSDGAITGFHLDEATENSSISLSGGDSPWLWTLQSTTTLFDDRADPYIENGWVYSEARPAYRNQLNLLQLTYNPGTHLLLQPMLQHNSYRDTAGSRSRSLNWGMNLGWQILPEKLRLDTSYSWVRSRQSNSYWPSFNSNSVQRAATAELRWKALEGKDESPAADIYLQGSYGAVPFDPFGTLSEWQLYLGFTLASGEGL